MGLEHHRVPPKGKPQGKGRSPPPPPKGKPQGVGVPPPGGADKNPEKNAKNAAAKTSPEGDSGPPAVDSVGHDPHLVLVRRGVPPATTPALSCETRFRRHRTNALVREKIQEVVNREKTSSRRANFLFFFDIEKLLPTHVSSIELLEDSARRFFDSQKMADGAHCRLLVAHAPGGPRVPDPSAFVLDLRERGAGAKRKNILEDVLTEQLFWVQRDSGPRICVDTYASVFDPMPDTTGRPSVFDPMPPDTTGRPSVVRFCGRRFCNIHVVGPVVVKQIP